MTGRVLHAGLDLLDRQLVDRSGVRCGKVDDLELSEPDADGVVWVAALRSGPGVLLTRTGHRRLGRWLTAFVAHVFDAPEDDPTRIRMAQVASIGDHVSLAVDHTALASHAGERWCRDHVVAHIPGAGDAPQ